MKAPTAAALAPSFADTFDADRPPSAPHQRLSLALPGSQALGIFGFLVLLCATAHAQHCPWQGEPLPPPVTVGCSQDLTGQWRLTGYNLHLAKGLSIEDLRALKADYGYLDSAILHMVLEFTPTGQIRQTPDPAKLPHLTQVRQFALLHYGPLGTVVQVYSGCSQQPERYSVQAIGEQNLSLASVEQGGLVAVEFHWQRLPAQ